MYFLEGGNGDLVVTSANSTHFAKSYFTRCVRPFVCASVSACANRGAWACARRGTHVWTRSSHRVLFIINYEVGLLSKSLCACACDWPSQHSVSDRSK